MPGTLTSRGHGSDRGTFEGLGCSPVHQSARILLREVETGKRSVRVGVDSFREKGRSLPW